MKQAWTLTIYLLGTIVVGFIQPADAQECPGMTAYMIDADEQCIDLSELESPASDNTADNSQVTVDILLDEDDGNPVPMS